MRFGIAQSEISFPFVSALTFHYLKHKMNTIKKLTRPRNGRMLGGVCAGIGEYLGIDPTVVRIICVLLSIGTIGLALLVYLVLCFVIPESY